MRNNSIFFNTSFAPNPFGFLMDGRVFGGEKYRFGFNGKACPLFWRKNDDEVKGDGNSLDFGARIYDTRLGRFLSIDPLSGNYPWYTPYQFAGNKPIWASDLDGAEEIIRNVYTWNGIPWFEITTYVKVENRAQDHTQRINNNLEYIKFVHNNQNPNVSHLNKKAPQDWRPEQVKSVSTLPDHQKKNAEYVGNTDVRRVIYERYSLSVERLMNVQFNVNIDKNTSISNNSQLQIIAVALLKFDNLTLEITGSASSGGDYANNQKLAENRALVYKDAIVKTLTDKGATPAEIAKVTAKIQIKSKVATGPNNPSDQNATLTVKGDLRVANNKTRENNGLDQ